MRGRPVHFSRVHSQCATKFNHLEKENASVHFERFVARLVAVESNHFAWDLPFAALMGCWLHTAPAAVNSMATMGGTSGGAWSVLK